MLNKTSTFLAHRLLMLGAITEDTLDIYVYGFELLISFLFSTSMILLAGILVGKIIETVAFLAVFIFLRSFSGGFHAKTYLICNIVTLSTFSFVMLASHFLDTGYAAFIVLSFFGLIILIIWAPIDNPNKIITNEKKRVFKVVSLVLFAFFVMIGVTTIPFSTKISSVIFYTLFVDIILIAFEVIKRMQ